MFAPSSYSFNQPQFSSTYSSFQSAYPRYQPATQQANFGCASNFPIEVGGAVCGEGAGFVNQQGCSMVNTRNGPCYFCCCKGGSCNHPQVFAREASKLPINQQQMQTYNPTAYNPYSGQNYYPFQWYNTASTPSNPFFLIAIILIIFLVLGFSA
ncbi:hypothetical protein GCK72_008213 [Caenorhabditis remanei]|uniref:Uncharacterized protein n=1 Tax=Caenorhabditis remanei TaxID=31234 RepID=A0A6A5GWU3_CAERE|nr:hypothetical protein GCK72_008213 [Caenorhabditis remanei]KAF1759968.1 hypothetical protein GCK72_008213 [Caenorhabditis remanei]